MKWLFLLLVLANAAVIGWQGFAASEPLIQSESVYAPPVSERIYLTNEVRPVDSVPQNTQSTESQRVQQQLEAAIANVEQAPLEADVSTGTVVGSDDQALVAEELSEDALLCPIVALERDADRKEVMGVFNAAGLGFTQNETTGQREKFWLYIPAPATSQAADDIVLRLKTLKIDSYVIARGEMKNRISLGLYSSEVRAQQAQAAIIERSRMDVQIYAHERTVSLYELLLSEPIRESAWQAVMDQLDFSKLLIKVEKNPC